MNLGSREVPVWKDLRVSDSDQLAVVSRRGYWVATAVSPFAWIQILMVVRPGAIATWSEVVRAWINLAARDT